jgi:hypothetical protein
MFWREEHPVSPVLAKDEVELINPLCTKESFEALRAYHTREWTDKFGKWHVVIDRTALRIVEDIYQKTAKALGVEEVKP